MTEKAHVWIMRIAIVMGVLTLATSTVIPGTIWHFLTTFLFGILSMTYGRSKMKLHRHEGSTSWAVIFYMGAILVALVTVNLFL